jgi:hypothetical protein
VPEIRITFVHLALLINRPTDAIVVLPFDDHDAELVLPTGQPVPLANGVDLSLGKGGAPFTGAPTRASSEYVVHLDHVFGTIVQPNQELLAAEAPQGVNARIFLKSGRLAGLPCTRFVELQNVIWTFTRDGEIGHRQKLTDTLQYSVAVVPGDDYELSISGRDSFRFEVQNSDLDFVIKNADICDEMEGGPPYILREYRSLYHLTSEGERVEPPLPVAIPSAFLPAVMANKSSRPGRATRGPLRSCSAVCGNAQVL